MVKKRKILAIIILLSLISITKYVFNFVWLVESFFSISFSNLTSPIDELFKEHYVLSSYSVITPTAVDAKGYIYVVGAKKGKVRVLVLNHKGKIERIITPRLKDNSFLRICLFISVSPSGKHIWTFEPYLYNNICHDYIRIAVHDLNGTAKAQWLVPEIVPCNHWRLFAYTEDKAYVVYGGSLFCLHFTIGQKHPQKYKMSANFFGVFFHNGKFWTIKKLDKLIKEIGGFDPENLNEQASAKGLWFGVATWTPEEGIQLVKKFPVKSSGKVGVTMMIEYLKWIDYQGNFYAFSYALPVSNPITFLFKIGPIRRLLQALDISDISERRVEAIQIFSSEGKLLDTIILPKVIYPGKDEKIEYGQLVKADEKGIYLELAVKKFNELKEYRIVRIVKKRRWQVWWEGLMAWIKG